jgi:CDGSH-type Zn-finger protein/uncharacterized Fe-S cluster protein YjdI
VKFINIRFLAGPTGGCEHERPASASARACPKLRQTVKTGKRCRDQEDHAMEEVEVYRGKTIVIRNRGSRCIHSRHCVLSHPGVFIPNAPGPWIEPDKAASETVIAIVTRCPSGALSYEPLDGRAAEAPPGVNTVRTWQDGPLAFHGTLDIAGDTSSFRATLCRCGQSRNKPYCDHSHEAAGFKASGEPAGRESEPLTVPNGPLKITPQPNGSLRVEGPLEICAASGRTVTRGVKQFLCRCGGSNNKPFCDGTHSKIGFTAP